MKRIILLLISLFVISIATAQEITREQLLKLYYKAQKAEQAGNSQEALEVYKTILALNDALPIPYLKMADIYAANSTDPTSAAMAIALYNKYLNLQTDNKDAPAIKNKIVQLQQVAAKQNVNLKDVVYINQKQAENIIVAKTGRGIIAANREELEQQVEEENNLYVRAQEAINNNDIEKGEQYIEQMRQQTDPNPMTMQSNIMLAETLGEKGDVHKMKEVLTTLEEDMIMYTATQGHQNIKVKNALPFENDICGIWVSDLAYNDATPYLAIEIKKDNSPGKYKATILPYCTLAEQYKMYSGKPFQYVVKYNDKSQNYFAYSSIDSVNTTTAKAYFFFGNKKYRGTGEGIDDVLKVGINAFVGDMKKDIKESVAPTPQKDASVGDKLASAGLGLVVDLLHVGLVADLLQAGLTLLTVKKTTETGLDLNIQQLFAGCADINLMHTTFVTKTNGYKKQSSNSSQMRIYKLYPEDKILFAANGNELFGHRTFRFNEMQRMEEYLQAVKSRNDFNKQSYKKLSGKIVDYCFSKATEDSVFKNLAYECRTRFEYAARGLTYREFANNYGSFTGWVDISGKMNGMGKCTLYDGTTYIGSWEDNKYSGKGKITYRDKSTNEMCEYTGTFKNNKYDGKGLLYSNGMVYDGDFKDGLFEGSGKLTDGNGDEYNGTWKKSSLVQGIIKYANGDRYEGECAYNKKTQQIDREGQGTMTYANGEVAAGKWKTDKLITK